MKRLHTISGTSITQEATAGFLETGRYEHHLRKLRQTLHTNSLHYAQTISDYFPDGTLASRPMGGSALWVELPPNFSSINLYEKAVQQKISFAPGAMFTLQQQFDNCLRLNYALLWTEKLENNLKLLGRLAKSIK